MSETDQAAPAAVPGPGAGAMLRAAREAAGVHIASLAVALKVPVARLEALEAERYELLPDAPFVRALAGSICRVLKIDAAPVLALLPQRAPALQAEPPRADGPTLRAAPPAPARLSGARSGARHPVLWTVVVLLLAAAGLMLLPDERLASLTQALRGDASTGSLPQPVGGATEAEPAPAEPPVAAEAPMGPESTRAQGPTFAGGAVPAGAVAPAPAPAPAAPAMLAGGAGAATPGTGPAGSATAAPSADTPSRLQPSSHLSSVASAPDRGTLSFTASGQSWVRVTNAQGATVFERVLVAGAVQNVEAAPPLSVVVGNAGVTEVKVRGQAFDLSGIARNNVARFEVR